LNPITSISAYKRTGSSNVDGIYVTYSNGDYDTIGSMDAVENGALIAALNITVGDRAKQLWVWVDEATTAIQALHINMVSGAKLAASQSRPFDQAALAVTSASGLGSGLLLGLAEAVKPGSGALSALSFSFLKTPTSTGVAVDMPAIDLIAAKFAPAFNSKSSITMSGGGSQVGGAPQLCWPWNRAVADEGTERRHRRLRFMCLAAGDMPRLQHNHLQQDNLHKSHRRQAPEAGHRRPGQR
jgi:hypothetical protein